MHSFVLLKEGSAASLPLELHVCGLLPLSNIWLVGCRWNWYLKIDIFWHKFSLIKKFIIAVHVDSAKQNNWKIWKWMIIQPTTYNLCITIAPVFFFPSRYHPIYDSFQVYTYRLSWKKNSYLQNYYLNYCFHNFFFHFGAHFSKNVFVVRSNFLWYCHWKT